MLLVIHACIGMPMASLDCGKRFLDAHSISVKREYRQIEHLFVTDFVTEVVQMILVLKKTTI